MAKNKPYRYFLYLALELLCAVVLILPRKVNYLIAAFWGYSAFWLLKSEREKTTCHLKEVFGLEKTDSEYLKIGERVFIHLAQSAIDVLLFPRLNRKKIEQLVDNPEGTGKLDRGLEPKRGVIALTGHIGNWELLASYFRFLGYPGSLMGRRIYYEPYNRVLIRLREKGLVSTIYRDESPRKVISQLKDNYVIGISADQDIDSIEGVFVSFFGRPTWTPTGPAKLAMTTGAAIVPAFMIHEGDRYRLYLEEPIFPPDHLSKEEGVKYLTQKWSEVVESYVRRFPDQWVWMHSRWKTQSYSDVQKHRNEKLVRVAS